MDGGYSFKILDSQFQIIEDLGEYEGSSKGNNFQDLCVSGDYIINFPLTLGLGIGDFLNVYSISRRALVSCPQLDFGLDAGTVDEPESICELEPGVFAAVVNVYNGDGSRRFSVYKTMVPYNFPAKPAEEKSRKKRKRPEMPGKRKKQNQRKELRRQPRGTRRKTSRKRSRLLRERIKSLMKTTYSMKNIMKTALLIFFALDIVLVLYLWVLAIRRKRKRKLEKARRERQRIRQEIRAMYGERL